MSEMINAKGLACPQPVILTKKALDSQDELIVLVDNTTALENVKRFAATSGCTVEAKDEPDGTFRINIKKKQVDRSECNTSSEKRKTDDAPLTVNGPTIFVIASNVMGCGNDELGAILMKAFKYNLL